MLIVGSATTVMLAVEVFPAPSFAEVAWALLFLIPPVVPVTSRDNVQLTLGPRIPLDKLTTGAPAAALTTPTQVVLKLLGVDTKSPAGRLSVKATPVRVTPMFGSVMVKVSEVLPLISIAAAPNAFATIGGLATVRVKTCVASGPMPLCAVMTRTSTSSVPEFEVPDNVAVPSPLSIKVKPAGSGPASLKDGAGKPVVVMVNDPATRTSNVAWFALVMDGGTVPKPLTASV